MNSDVLPPLSAVRDAVSRALREDLEPLGDITGALVGIIDVFATAEIVSRAEGVVAGRLCVVETFAQVDPSVALHFDVDDASEVDSGERIATVSGPLASVLAGERTALNFLGHLSGIASFTRRHVRAAGGRCRVLDTRKTTPGLRALEKAAVRAGGGFNHRGSLSDGVLLKDNHLAHVELSEAVRRSKFRWPGRTVQVECETLGQVREALAAGADRVMLDNMDLPTIEDTVELVDGRCEIEVTGGVNLQNLSDYAATGVDFVSVGALTHSAPVLDIGLDVDVDDHRVD
ncbi:MAG TPA: carboxylating nicotinate-nucleotide diphosphorylase [Acidimicrobiales bacterium]